MDHLFDDELSLDYSEEDDVAPADHARSQTPDAPAKNNREPEALECFALHSEFKVTTGNTVPFADSHLHVDESLRFRLDNWTASDILENGIYELSAYVAVFCRPKAYMNDHNQSKSDSMTQASRSGSLLQSLCLGATIGTHPGNAHEWSADVAARITKLVKKGSQDGYRIIGLGEAGLDLTKSAPSRDRKGRRQNPKDPDAIFDHQLPAFREQIRLAKTLRNELGNPLPLVLHLREAKANATTVWNRALLTLRTENLNKDHPIHCHFFEGGLTEYQDWIEFFPRTMFSINAKSLTKHLSTGQLDFLRQAPLTRITFESDMPHCSITSTPYSNPANAIEAARKFQYFGRRRESLPDILRQALVNTITFYRPDITIVKLQDQQSHAMTQTNLQPSAEGHDAGTSTDSPEPQVEITEPIFVDTLDAERPTPAGDLELDLVDEIAAEDTAKTPTLIVSDCTITGWEPQGICTPKEGRHRTCRPLYVQEHFNTDYITSTTAEIPERDRHRLFGRQVPTVLQSLLVLWAARLISGHAKAVVKFINQLLDSRPEEAVRIWKANYNAVTVNVQRFPAIISQSDLRLALRKRAYSCDVACNNLLANDENGGEPYFCSSAAQSASRKRLQNELEALWQATPELLHWLTRYVRSSAMTAEMNYRIFLQDNPDPLADTEITEPRRRTTPPLIARRIAAADKVLPAPRRSRPSEKAVAHASPEPSRTIRAQPSSPSGDEQDHRIHRPRSRYHPYSDRRDLEEPRSSGSLTGRVQW